MLARNTLGQYRAVKVLHRTAFGDDRPFEREFAGIQRFNFPSPVIDGAGNRKIMGVGAVKFRIDAGAAGDDHAYGRGFMLNDGIGGEGGA